MGKEVKKYSTFFNCFISYFFWIIFRPFEVVVDPTMHEITHFCLPKLKPLLQHSTVFFHEVSWISYYHSLFCYTRHLPLHVLHRNHHHPHHHHHHNYNLFLFLLLLHLLLHHHHYNLLLLFLLLHLLLLLIHLYHHHHHPHHQYHIFALFFLFSQVIEFYEETVGTSFPYTCYKQVFVDEAYDDSQAYASMAIFR